MTQPKTKLIQALREAARRLDGGIGYDWNITTQCNCGVLASCVVGRTLGPEDLCHDGICVGGTWTDRAKSVPRCSVIGSPLNQVFRALDNVGLRPAELESVEYCCDLTVLQRMGVNRLHRRFKNAAFVARYFNAWADLLEEESRPITSTADQVPAIEAQTIEAAPVQPRALETATP